MLKKSLAIYLVGEILSKGMPFLLMPYLTRELGVEGFGELSILLAWAGIVSIFISYVQEAAIIRYMFYYGARSVSLIVTAGRLYSLTITLLAVVVGIAFRNEIILLVAIFSFSQCILKVELVLQQGLNSPYRYVAITALSNLIAIVLTLFFFELLEPNATNRFMSVALGNLLGVLLLLRILRKNQSPRKWSSKKVALGASYIMFFSSPLLLNSLSSFFKGQFDRILVSEQFSSKDLGVYSAGVQLASILLLLLLSVGKAIEPYIYSKLKNEDWKLSQITLNAIKLSVLLIVAVIIVYIIPETFYVMFLGSGYEGVKGFVSQFVFAFSLIGPYMFYSIFLSYKGKTKELTYANLVAAVVYLILLFSFAKLGITHLAFATVISNVLLLFIVIIIAMKISKEEDDTH